MQVPTFLIICGLMLQSIILANSELNKLLTLDEDTKSATKIAITNYQIKSTKAADLTTAQLKEAKGAKIDSKDDTPHRKTDDTSNEVRRRFTTPTDNKTLDKASGSANGTAAKEIPMAKAKIVAEGVAIDVSHGTQITNENTTSSKPTNSTASREVTITNSQHNSAGSTGSTSVGSANDTTKSALGKSNSTSTSTTTSTTTTTTTTTTTPKPKKPIITYGIEDFPNLDANVLQYHDASKVPTPETAPIREPPSAQPSQEIDSVFPYNSSHDYIVPILAIIFAVPLAMGAVITAYRRFRDFWSTRHYRRMDFLVDGMYNDD